MTVTVQDVMRQMRNYFIASTLTGTFTVADGIIDLDPPLAPGAWVAIEGSGSLDGVHQLDENGMPAFIRMTSRFGPVSSPVRIRRVISAFSFGVPPISSESSQLFKQNCSGVIV